MSFQSTEYSTCSTMGIYEQNNQISMWDDSFRADSSQYTGSSTVLEADVKIDNGVKFHGMVYPLIIKLQILQLYISGNENINLIIFSVV